MEVDDEAPGAERSRSDLMQRTVGAGASGVVFSDGDVHGGGETSVRLKAQGWFMRTELEESEHLEGMKLDVRQVRLRWRGSMRGRLVRGGAHAVGGVGGAT